MSKYLKKLIPILFILTILVGVFGVSSDANAVDTPAPATATPPATITAPVPSCTDKDGKAVTEQEAECKANNHHWNGPNRTGVPNPGETSTKSDNAFLNSISDSTCGIGGIFWSNGSSLTGCIIQIAYYTLYVFPAFLLWLGAYFFNTILSITLLDSSIYSSSKFIPEAWAIVRDLSNIFFIIILLFIAFQTILGIGDGHGGGPKKAIAQVVVMALLINFSMFFTKVVIDSANILALVFYNKINVETVEKSANAAPNVRPYPNVTNNPNEKDISGGMVKAFDPTQFLTQEFFDKASTQYIPASPTNPASSTKGKVPLGIMLGIIVLTGFIMSLAAYAFFIAGASFLGRLVELWVLIIFSPFAFMSSTVSFLDHIPTIGWKQWFERLLATSFMAPIFMFFMYFIFKMINANPYDGLLNKNNPEVGTIVTILSILIPALIILSLLLKAIEYAKKGSGQFGEMAIKLSQAALGIAVGGGVGLMAKGLQGGLGHAGKRVFESKTLADMETNGGWASRRLASGLRSVAGGNDGKGGFAGSSFDLRKGVLGGALKAASAVTGLDLGGKNTFMMGEDGGYEADLKRKDAIRKARAEGLKVKEGEEEKQKLNQLKEEQQEVSLKNEAVIHEKDKEIESAKGKRETLEKLANSTKDTPEYEANRQAFRDASDTVARLQSERGAIKNGMMFDPKTGKYNTHNGNITRDEVAKANIEAENAESDLSKADAARIKAIEDETAAKNAETQAITRNKTATDANTLAEKDLIDHPTSTEAINNAKATRIALENAEKETTETKKAVQQAIENSSNTTQAYSIAEKISEEKNAYAKRANEDAVKAGGKFGNSQNNYEDTLIPHAEHHIKHINDRRVRGYATNLQNQIVFPWNQAARNKSAHEIRMGVKADSHSKKKGGGLGEHLAASFIAEATIGGGHGTGGGDSHASGDAHGGAANHH